MNAAMDLAMFARRAAVFAAGGFLIIAAFQLLLALGVPWGNAAWGGGEATLTSGQRVASGVAMFVYVAAALVVLGRGGYWGERDAGVFRIGVWVLAVSMTIGAIVNAASSSPWERFMWAPFALALALLCLVVARSTKRTI